MSRFWARWEAWDEGFQALWSKKIAPLLVLAFVVWIMYDAYMHVDSAGWIPHTSDTQVMTYGDWWPNETKTCYGSLGRDGTQTLLNCSEQDGTIRELSVKYWGRISRPERSSEQPLITWKCKKGANSLVCCAQN